MKVLMGRMFLVPAILAAVLALWAQTPASTPEKATEKVPAPCTVSGRVVTATDGTPLKSARVALVPETEHDYSQTLGATSDSDGRFIISKVPPGRYKFFASRTGYVNQEYKAKGTVRGALLALQPGQEVKEVLFRMTMAAVIAGRVKDDDGEPMVAIQVVALRKATDEEVEDEAPYMLHKSEMIPASAATTDDRGQYRIFGLKPGEYYIRATDSFDPPRNIPVGEDFWIRQSLGTDYAPVYYPGVLQLGQAQAVLVRAGDEAQADFSMQRVKTVQVSGRVFGPDGNPATRTSVYLGPAGTDEYINDYYTSTDEKGYFTLQRVSPGSYFLTAEREEGEETYSSRQRIDVGKDDIESLTLALGEGMRFSGSVIAVGSEPPDMQRITIGLSSTGEGQPSSAWSRVKKSGAFELTDVKDANYSISVYGLEPGWYTKSARLGQDDVLEQGLQVEKRASSGTLEIVISSASAQLEGSVTAADQPIAGARVRVTPDPKTPYNDTRSRSAATDQTGHFSIVGLAPGKYRVIAKSVPSEGTALSSDPQTVTVSERDHKTIELKIVPPAEQ
jgi:protocatechuate 3,4-dioxygenase beta subunit